jgi:hypothetical protein
MKAKTVVAQLKLTYAHSSIAKCGSAGVSFNFVDSQLLRHVRQKTVLCGSVLLVALVSKKRPVISAVQCHRIVVNTSSMQC